MNLQGIAGQIRTLWGSLSVFQRISIAVAALAVAGGLVGFSHWRRERDFKPLYTGMSTEDAAAIVQKLKTDGAEYRVSDDGTSVAVPTSRIAELRLDMAAAGLPKTGRIGFELFDKTSVGTTDFAEQVNFRRALEGELERSIRSVSEVEQARVHLTFAKDSVFLESKTPAKASVLLRIRTGVQITPANVSAITHLVASAVDGLAPEDVSVLDMNGNLLSRPKNALELGGASDELIQYRQKLEKDLLAKANATLEPALGAGRYRVGLSVDCDFSTSEQSDELYDPEKSVMTTSQKTEETSSLNTAGGVPGTASNLPRSPGRTSGGSTVVRRTENVAYQSSRTVRKTKLPQGGIRRISASVLLDQTMRWENQSGRMQRVLVPPSPENLRAIRELVSAAIGLVPERDQLVVESLPFEQTLQAPPPPTPTDVKTAPGGAQPPAGGFQIPVWAYDWRVWAGAGGGLVVMFLGWKLLRRVRRKKVKVTQTPAVAAKDGPPAVAAPSTAAALESAPAEKARALAQPPEKVAQTARIELLVEELRQGVQDDPALAASVLRTWLEEAEA